MIFLTFIDGDVINRSVIKGKYKIYQNNWEILEGKWTDIPSGQKIKRTDSRNSTTANFLHAKKGNELHLQSPISFSIMLFTDADETTCFYNSYKDGIYYSGYKFNSDCYFMLNFTNQQDMSAETKKSDIVWTKNTVKDVQTVFIVPNAEYSTIRVASAWASDAETNKGAYRGTLTYTTTKDSYGNSQQKFWADDGSGKNVLTRDLNDSFSGTTSNRPKHPQYNQQYFDTTINKMIYYINGNWVDAMGAIMN